MCQQGHVDDWLVRNPTRPQINQFLAWAVRRGHAHDVTAPSPADRRTRHTLTGDDERWLLIQRLDRRPGPGDERPRRRATGSALQPADRPAGDLENHRCRRQRKGLGDIETRRRPAHGARTSRSTPGRTCRNIVADTPLSTVGTNPWLFPGGRSGRHLSPSQMGVRLRRIGISPRIARNTALIELAGELPAAVLAKLLGFSIKRAVTWNIEAGNTNPVMPLRSHAVARGSSRIPRHGRIVGDSRRWNRVA